MNRLVDFANAEARPTPVLLLADLRQIDPTVELVYVGGGDWWLGAVRSNKERYKKGELIVQQMGMLPVAVQQKPTIQRNVMLGRLLMQGFARIEVYSTLGDPSGTVTVRQGDPSGYECQMVEDFRARDHEFRRDGGKEDFAEVFDDLVGDAKRRAHDKMIEQYLSTDARAHFRREIKDRVQFGHGGMTGGRAARTTNSGIILPYG